MYLSGALEPGFPSKMPEGRRVKQVSGVTIENVNLDRQKAADQAPFQNFAGFRVSYGRYVGCNRKNLDESLANINYPVNRHV